VVVCGLIAAGGRPRARAREGRQMLWTLVEVWMRVNGRRGRRTAREHPFTMRKEGLKKLLKTIGGDRT